LEKKHGEKKVFDETYQPSGRVKAEDPKGEKRKEMETGFEEHIRSP
jgi:hypothetical protein